jgi:hypothetical protein
MPDEHALALLHNGYRRQHFVTFEPAAPDLIDAMEESPAPPPTGRKRAGGGKEATDVH